MAGKLYPLNAPGMSLPGDDFLLAAELQGDKLQFEGKGKKRKLIGEHPRLTKLVCRALYSRGELTLAVAASKQRSTVLNFVAGHVWREGPGDPRTTGPELCDVMVVGSMCTDEDQQQQRLLQGRPGQYFLQTMQRLGLSCRGWYVTNLLKTSSPDPTASSQKATWFQAQQFLLEQELRLVRPKYILCLGSEAVKFFFGKNMSLEKSRGQVMEYSFPIGTDESSEAVHTATVITTLSPSYVSREKGSGFRDRFEQDLSNFVHLTKGVRCDQEETGIDHKVVRTLSQLKQVLKQANAENPTKLVAVDAEWHGNHPQNEGSYLRCVQFSWAHKKAACVVFHAEGGEPDFWHTVVGPDGTREVTTEGGAAAAVRLLKDYFADKRVVGHFFNSDLEWLVFNGLDLRPQFDAADKWQECPTKGGWDTGLMMHALDETSAFDLTTLALKYTSAPRYDVKLDKWKADYCKRHGIKAAQLDGYGECPAEVLYPYACLHRDSLVQLGDGTWRKISELVRDRYSGTVKAMLDGAVVNAKVTGWHRAEVGQRAWFQLRTATTPEGRHGLLGPKFTPDHEVLTRRGKVRVDSLRPGRDEILTDEVQFSPAQLSVLLGSALGDGGYCRKHGKKIGFGFSQAAKRAAYADWKAQVFANYGPVPRNLPDGDRGYALPFGRYLRHLSERFPVHELAKHGKRKLKLTKDVLDNLGDLGLAVWYQDDGVLVRDGRNKSGLGGSSRIICRKFTDDEIELSVRWLSDRLGEGVSYNRNQGFLQIAGSAFVTLHKIIAPHMHPALSYKTPLAVGGGKPVAPGTALFYEKIEEVVPWRAKKRRGSGVRYCLTVDKAHNFLTQVGFVSNCLDADVTRRIAVKLAPLLSKDPYGNNCWKPFWLAQRVAKVAYEINTVGLLVDRKRLDALFDVYSVKKAEMLQAIKDAFQWPNLNMASVQHVKELLFGEQYNGRRDAETGEPIKLRPPGAKSLYAQPVLNTAKRPKAWAEIMAEKKESENNASTGRQALGILLRESSSMKVRRKGKWVVEDCGKQVQMVRDYRFIEQVLKFVLRPPATTEVVTEDDSYVEEFMEDEDGDYIYDRGIPGFICSDCRIRTNMSQVKETGRWSSSRPPLQNFSKRREEDYARILGDRYTSPLRSMFVADPGHLLVEADFVGAELFGMAILSGDVQMIDHARRNQLPEDHPDFYDIHSNIAVLAFGYKCPPTKSGLKSIGKAHMRIVAKCVPGHVRLQTSEGWLRMETLCGQVPAKQGVSVDESGVSVASLVGHTPLLSLYNGGRKRCRRLETERGYQLDTADGHHIAVMKADGKLGFKKAKDVKLGDWVALRMGSDTFGRCVEFPPLEVPKRTNYKDLALPAEFDEDWAAFLGLYLAEGSSDENGFQLCLAYEDDPELANETRCLLRRVFGTRVSETEVSYEVWQNQKKFSVSSVKLAAWFRENVPGDSHTRCIPDFVFKWPKQLQAAFLRWLFEGDGSVKRSGTSVAVGYSTASEGLARDVQLLLTGFGVETSLASERREGYDGTYWALSVFGNESRARFAEQIGFVTAADCDRFKASVDSGQFRCDRRVIPSQVEWLRDLMPAVRSPVKEKCRECVRERSRVALNPTRLEQILAAVDESKLGGKSREAYEHLQNLFKLPLVFQQVRSVTNLGILPVYDVETTPTNHHTVSYGGFLSHQSVVFGVAYGRGAKAIALAAREEGVTVSVEEAQTVIDTIFALYPNLVGFFEECRLRAASRDYKKPAPGWLRNALGRYRRFPATKDREVIGEFERQAMNFPIQSLIADAMNCAMHNLYLYRKYRKLNFRFVLQIHDSLLFLVPNAEVPRFIDEVIPVCMEQGVPIYPTSLDGRRKEGSLAYYLKTDVEVAEHWGDPVYPHECVAHGVHPKYAHWRKSALAKDAWESSSHPKKVYLSRDRRMHKLSDSGGLLL